jgi:hypothetical protein
VVSDLELGLYWLERASSGRSHLRGLVGTEDLSTCHV